MTVSITLRPWAFLLVLLAPLAHGDGYHPEFFGYKIGQCYKVTAGTERRMYGVIVADPAPLTLGLEELLLTVTPKTHTIVNISGILRTDDVEQIKRLEDHYWELLKARHEGWQQQRLGIGISFYKSPYWLQARTRRTRTEGIFELSVTLEYGPGTLERRTLDALRIEEARQIIADYQSGGS